MGKGSEAGNIPVVDLGESRARIDRIDEQIVQLFCERMGIVNDVAAYKRATGKAVFDARREAEKIATVTALAPEEYREYMAPLFTTLMELSKSYQDKALYPTNGLMEQLKRVRPSGVFPTSASICVQGVAGAWQHIAAMRLFENPSIEFVSTWDNVCNAIAEGKADFGILPLENTTTGTVNRAWDLLREHGLRIARTVNLRIEHDLLAKPGAHISFIHEVFSHEQALRQCEGYLEKLGPHVVRSIRENTASAARAVAESSRRDVAAICSSACADIYGLIPLAHSIQDQQGNYTRFACVCRDECLYQGADRTSLLLVIPHEPGSLYRALARFAQLGINLIKLESRPIPGKEFEFMFYVDIECVPGDEAFDRMAQQVPALCDECVYLGSYSEM